MICETDHIFMTGADAKLHYKMVKRVERDNTPLVLIHGQGMCVEDYRSIFEPLCENYTLYLVDCFGHGESDKNAGLYRCNIIGDAIAEMIQKKVGNKSVLTGHSSGGILAAYIAGKLSASVKGLLLEDPPFFNVQPCEYENTFVYKDSFLVSHEFLRQTKEQEYIVYYLEHGYIYHYLGQRFLGKDWVRNLAQEAREKLKAAPGAIPELRNIPAKSLHGFLYWNKFDLLFSESFYTGEWFDGVDQEQILKSVKCPTVYLKAKTRYGKDGVLWAANTEESASKVMRLLKNGYRKTVRSGHDIHFEKPRHFLKAMKILEKMMRKQEEEGTE